MIPQSATVKMNYIVMRPSVNTNMSMVNAFMMMDLDMRFIRNNSGIVFHYFFY
jgi:hypothetical protein